MNNTTLIINLFAATALIVSTLKDRKNTLKGLKIAYHTFWRILPMVLIILLLVSLLMGFVDRQLISSWLGGTQDKRNIVIAALLGSVLMIPSIVGFPLAAALLEKGAAVTAVATFITTLTMIGFVTLPLEIREMGKRFSFWRNGLSLVIALLIGLFVGAVV